MVAVEDGSFLEFYLCHFFERMCFVVVVVKRIVGVVVAAAVYH